MSKHGVNRLTCTLTHIGKDVPDEIARHWLLQRLMANSRRTATGCLEWTGYRNAEGYGFTSVKGRSRRTHVLMYGLVKEPLPPGMLVRHTCDNPPCMEPDHLLPGTKAQNKADCVERNRHRFNRVAYTHCASGHPFSAENTRLATDSKGRVARQCKTCQRAHTRKRAGWPKERWYDPPGAKGQRPSFQSDAAGGSL